jgi:26S proteasome regulatory subunit N7
MRILAYAQLLESYRSLTIESLSGAFGVSKEFVDKLSLPPQAVRRPEVDPDDSELSRYIASSRLHATIDAVNGIVETTRPSLKNEQCESVVRKGDVLLGSVQRLGKVLW